MQHVGEPGTPEMKTDEKPSGGLSPVKAFFALLALLVAIGGLFLLTRPTDESNRGATRRSDNFALTDAEAIERFKELEELELRAYDDRDSTLLNGVFTTDSVVRTTVVKEIRRLRRDSVESKTTFDTKSLDVVTNDDSRIVIDQIVVVRPRFVDERGMDVTGEGSVPQRQEVRWTLHKQGSEWLIYDSVITESEVIGK